MEELDVYTCKLGKIVSNLQSLEFALRVFLNDPALIGKQVNAPSLVLQDLREGEVVPLNSLTNYDFLGETIQKYNIVVVEKAAQLCVDERVVDLRDAIAHGRVSSQKPQFPMQLLKFAKPQNDQVRVILSVWMTEEWLEEQVNRVVGEIEKVIEASQRFCENPMGSI